MHLLYTRRLILLGAVDSDSKESACTIGNLHSISGQEDPWKRACKISLVFLPRESPWTEDPGGLQAMGLSDHGVIKCWT